MWKDFKLKKLKKRTKTFFYHKNMKWTDFKFSEIYFTIMVPTVLFNFIIIIFFKLIVKINMTWQYKTYYANFNGQLLFQVTTEQFDSEKSKCTYMVSTVVCSRMCHRSELPWLIQTMQRPALLSPSKMSLKKGRTAPLATLTMLYSASQA